MSGPRPNPILVDLIIDLLEPGEDQPFVLSAGSLAKVEAALRGLARSGALLDNVLGILELAAHAEDRLLDELAVVLRRLAESAGEALAAQADAFREEERARLGVVALKRAPLQGARPGPSSIKIAELRPRGLDDLHALRSEARRRARAATKEGA